MRILFVCKHNRFRSKVAEAIFNSLNKNKKVVAESRGVTLDEERMYICKNVLDVMREKGYEIKGECRKVNEGDLNDVNLIVIVADNVYENFFMNLGFSGNIIKWDIEDADESEYEKIKKIINEIEDRVKGLVKDLR